jgi:hypothetical protein
MTNKELVDKILEASNLLNKSSRSSYGNFIITSSTFAQTIKDFKRIDRIEKIKSIFKNIFI